MEADTSLLKGALAMSTITTILLVVLLAALFNPGLVQQIRDATAAGRAAGAPAIPGLEILLATLGSVAPDIALISGYVGDIVAGGLGKFRYSLTSILAIVGVILNKLIWGISELPGDYAALSARAGAFTGASVAAPAAAADAVRSVINAAGVIPAVGTARSGVGGAGDVFASGVAGAVGRSVDAASGRRRRIGEISPIGASFGLPTPAIPPSGPRPSARGAAGLRTMSGDDTMSGGIFGGGKTVQTGGANEISPEFARRAKPCVIRGLGFLDTQKSPMSIVVLVFIFFIYFLDMAVNLKRTGPEIAGNVFFGLFVLAINIYSFSVFNCYGSSMSERVFAIVKAASIGVVFGGIVFSIYNYTENGKQYLPVDPSPASISLQGTGTPNLPATATTPGGGGATSSQCAGPNDDDQFVCDAYKNGKKITTTVVQ